MKYVFTSLVLIFCVSSGFARYARDNDVILISREAGLFSCFFDVLTLIHGYETGRFNSIYVDFENNGLYYDKAYGPNWWTYYFYPIDLGDRRVPLTRCKRVEGCSVIINTIFTEKTMTPKEANTLISKYIRLEDSLQQEIDEFEKVNFTCLMIGVHYRGTDKKCEAPRVPYEVVFNQINKQIAELNSEEYKIFVATDEGAFLEEMLQLFGDKICYLESAPRSKNEMPVHNSKQNQYKNGKYAVMDWYLLSKVNILIRTSSNLSLASTYRNPDVKVINLNKRYGF